MESAIAIMPMISGSLSIICSITTICIIIRSNIGLSTTYHRILFGFNICEFFRALSHAASTLPVPKDGPDDIIFAIGNQASCNVQGFLHIFGTTSTLLYFCGLTTYFLLAIKIGMTDEEMVKRFEPCVHGISTAYGLVASIGVALHSGFYTSGSICWIAPKPMRCDEDPLIDCIEGSDHMFVTNITISFLMLFTFILSSTNLMVIFCNLLHQSTDQPSRVTLGAPSSTSNMDNAPELECLSPSKRKKRNSSLIDLYEKDRREKKRLSKAEMERKEGMTQCLLYIGAFFISYFSVAFSVVGNNRGVNVPFAAYLWAKFIYPLLGCLYFFVFIRPTMNKIRKRNPSLSRFQTLITAIKSRGETQQNIKRRTALNKKFAERLKVAAESSSSSGRMKRRRSFSECMNNTDIQEYGGGDDDNGGDIELVSPNDDTAPLSTGAKIVLEDDEDAYVGLQSNESPYACQHEPCMLGFNTSEDCVTEEIATNHPSNRSSLYSSPSSESHVNQGFCTAMDCDLSTEYEGVLTIQDHDCQCRKEEISRDINTIEIPKAGDLALE